MWRCWDGVEGKQVRIGIKVRVRLGQRGARVSQRKQEMKTGVRDGDRIPGQAGVLELTGT